MLSLVVFLSGLLWVSGSSTGAGNPSTLRPLTSIVDLTHSLGPKSYPWPGNSAFRFTRRDAGPYKDGGFIATNDFITAEHIGTHIDAPYHFNEAGWKVSQIPLSHLVAPGVLLDASDAAAANRDLALGVDALDAWEAQHGRLPRKSIVLVRFGWAAKYANREAYFGTTEEDVSKFRFPSLSEELAKALVEREVLGVGLDVPSADVPRASASAPVVHRVLCGANVFIVEHVNLRTQQLNGKTFTVHAIPAKIGQGTGAPVWIAAMPSGTI